MTLQLIVAQEAMRLEVESALKAGGHPAPASSPTSSAAATGLAAVSAVPKST